MDLKIFLFGLRGIWGDAGLNALLTSLLRLNPPDPLPPSDKIHSLKFIVRQIFEYLTMLEKLGPFDLPIEQPLQEFLLY